MVVRDVGPLLEAIVCDLSRLLPALAGPVRGEARYDQAAGAVARGVGGEPLRHEGDRHATSVQLRKAQANGKAGYPCSDHGYASVLYVLCLHFLRRKGSGRRVIIKCSG